MLGGAGRNTGTEACDPVVSESADVSWINDVGGRRPERRPRIGKHERFRHDTDDLPRLAVDVEMLAEHVAVAAESRAPESLADDDDPGRARGSVGIGEQPSEEWLRAEHRERRRRHPSQSHALGIEIAIGIRERRRHRDVDADLLERSGGVTIEDVRAGRLLDDGKIHAGHRVPHADQPVGVRIWQTPQEHGVDEPENGAPCANSERNR